MGDYEEPVEFTLKADPRSTATDTEIHQWGARLTEVSELISEILSRLDALRTARVQVQGLTDRYGEDTRFGEMANQAISQIDRWEARITQLKHQTLEDEDAWETMLAGQLGYLLGVINSTGAPVTEGAMTRLADLKAEWAQRSAELRRITEENLSPINAWAREQGVDHVRIP